MAQHTITTEQAYTIDLDWMNSGQPDGGLRLVDMRTAGNGYRTYLEVPGRDDAPYYMRQNGHFIHLAGPTLDEWQLAQDEAEFMAQWQEARDDYLTRRDLLSGLH